MFGFTLIPDYICSYLSNLSMNTSSNFHYIFFCYNKLLNLATNYEDTRIMIRHDLIVDEKSRELELRRSRDSSLLKLFNSKAMVRNLCTS